MSFVSLVFNGLIILFCTIPIHGSIYLKTAHCVAKRRRLCFHRRVSFCPGWCLAPGGWSNTPPPVRHTPPGQTHTPGQTHHPMVRHNPGQTPPPPTPRYGQSAVDTHPTGMHSCYSLKSSKTTFTCTLK